MIAFEPSLIVREGFLKQEAKSVEVDEIAELWLEGMAPMWEVINELKEDASEQEKVIKLLKVLVVSMNRRLSLLTLTQQILMDHLERKDDGIQGLREYLQGVYDVYERRREPDPAAKLLLDNRAWQVEHQGVKDTISHFITEQETSK